MAAALTSTVIAAEKSQIIQCVAAFPEHIVTVLVENVLLTQDSTTTAPSDTDGDIAMAEATLPTQSQAPVSATEPEEDMLMDDANMEGATTPQNEPAEEATIEHDPPIEVAMAEEDKLMHVAAEEDDMTAEQDAPANASRSKDQSQETEEVVKPEHDYSTALNDPSEPIEPFPRIPTVEELDAEFDDIVDNFDWSAPPSWPSPPKRKKE
ncbi:hypothetical protein BT63DRAFT_409251 [Microthyrium microscopicum]|uniref:Uncharacterized protein n=1 Tax=Microthyrium microscopicum TaxID=703497 RepID=A0A6A6UVY9_9PEZI|nr:hypothetical protein BT63DRAFT_409251 [Microthyrium microscopicum]